MAGTWREKLTGPEAESGFAALSAAPHSRRAGSGGGLSSFGYPEPYLSAGDLRASHCRYTAVITTLTGGAVIRWSLSAAPETETDGTAYSGRVTVASGQSLYSRAFGGGYLASPLALEAY